MRHHTWNKPKCLVSVEGRPILYHLFESFPDAAFVVVSDYSFDTLERYLRYNPPKVPVTLIRATGRGTCGGVGAALEHLPVGAPFVLTWSDLIVEPFPEPLEAPEIHVGVSPGVLCRWSIEEGGRLREAPSSDRGVLGLFVVPEKASLDGVPEEGEFVRWLAQRALPVKPFPLTAREVGEVATVERINERQGFARFFNRIELTAESVVKTAIIPAYEELLDREIEWYERVGDLGFRNVPALLSTRPLTLRRIEGRHPFELEGLDTARRRRILSAIMDALDGLHGLASAPADRDDVVEVYQHKTVARVMSAGLMIPTLDLDVVTVNGRRCRNPFSGRYEGLLGEVVEAIEVGPFRPIHGDPTFSNTVVDGDDRPWFIDPRGYFAKRGIFGDRNYDWAKLVYSVVGGYDGFNRRRLKLLMDGDEVEVLLEPNAWADAAPLIDERLGGEIRSIGIIHALIWFSLAGWVKDDVDSIIGAFHLGLWWLEEALS